FNVIHWNERIARSVGLPNVIAHGMFTMAQAGRYVTDWAGDAGALVEFGVRFSAMVVVPDDDTGATIQVRGTVEGKLGGNLGAGGAGRGGGGRGAGRWRPCRPRGGAAAAGSRPRGGVGGGPPPQASTGGTGPARRVYHPAPGRPRAAFRRSGR